MSRFDYVTCAWFFTALMYSVIIDRSVRLVAMVTIFGLLSRAGMLTSTCLSRDNITAVRARAVT